MDLLARFSFTTEIAAAVILLAGFLFGVIIRFALNRIAVRIQNRSGAIARSSGQILLRAAPLTFWIILAAALFWSLQMLEVADARWELLSKITDWLPKLVVSFAIVATSHLIGTALRDLVRGSIRQAELARQISHLSYAIVLMIGLFIAIQNIGIDVSFLQSLVLIVVAVGAAAFGLAFALGAQGYISNLIGQRELSRYEIGDHLIIDDIEGTVVEINKTNVVLLTNVGRATIPAARFLETTTVVVSEER